MGSRTTKDILQVGKLVSISKMMLSNKDDALTNSKMKLPTLFVLTILTYLLQNLISNKTKIRNAECGMRKVYNQKLCTPYNFKINNNHLDNKVDIFLKQAYAI